MATKAELIGLVLLRISGGRPTTDLRVHWGELASYIAPCVNYVQTKQYFIDKADEQGLKTINQLYLQVDDNVPVANDTVREKKYSDLPQKILTFPRGRALQYVGTVRGKPFIPIAEGGEVMRQYYCCFSKDQTFYSLEGNGKVFYYNLPPLMNRVMMKYVADASGLQDDDEVLLPSGSEPEVVQMMYEFFTGQRLMPNDPINDGQDLKLQTE